MAIKRQRSVVTLGIVAVLMAALLGRSQGFLAETEAVWTDPEHTSASITSGTWTTAGYGLGIGAKVVSAGGIRVLGGSPPPWVGASGSRDASSGPTPGSPGRTIGSGTGPYDSISGIGVNRLRMGGNSDFTGAVGATGCGSYSVGVISPVYCGATAAIATASASVSSMHLGGSVLQLVGPLITTSIVSIAGSAQALSAAVTCDLILGTSAITQQPTAGSPSIGNGTISIGGTAVAIPPSGSKTIVPNGTISQAGVGYRDIVLDSTQSSGGANGFAKLKLTGSISLLGLNLLSLSFDVDLVSVQCGRGTAPSATAASALARTAAAPEAALSSVPPSSSETTTPDTATPSSSETATESQTTTPSTTPTTTEEAAAAPPPEVTTTTEPPPVEAAEPPPVETAEPPPTPKTTTPPPTTTEPPDPATVFTGPAEGNVETLTFAGDVVCTAPTGADYTGTVELACDDGSSVAAIGSALTPAGVAASTAGGVWSPVLTAGGTARPVLAATRG